MTTCRHMIESSPFPMAVTEGPDHSIRFVNTAFCAILGKDSSELIARTIAEALPPAFADSIMPMLDRVFAGSKTGTVTNIRLLDSTRAFVFQSLTAWAMPPSPDFGDGLVIQMTDSTEQVLSDERQLRADATQALADAKQVRADAQQALSDARQARLDAEQTLSDARQANADKQQALSNARQVDANEKQALSDARQVLADAQQAETNERQVHADAEQALSNERQALSDKRQVHADAEQALSDERQAISNELQVRSDARQVLLNEQQERDAEEMQQINERLLLSGLKQQELAQQQRQSQEKLAKELQRERGIAAALQYFVLSENPEDSFPSLSMATVYEPALDEALVGGDFYDAFPSHDGHVILVVGDVTGKGLMAAARTVEVKYALRAFAQVYRDTAQAVSSLNDYICSRHAMVTAEDSRFIAMLVADIDTNKETVQFVSAGAERPLIIRSVGEIEEVPTIGMMLGVESGTFYSSLKRKLELGDTLVLTTDGLTESRNGMDFFGALRVGEATRTARETMTLQGVADAIVDAARRHGDGVFRDDICILLAGIKSPALR